MMQRNYIEEFSMGLFNKMESRREEVHITIPSQQNCSSFGREICYIVHC